ncbi:MAG: S8 family serine peptidase, partial [Anaerolineae bacterium]|nr:S8 family serine peptidase [Anaerolineae bacterium]
MFSRVLRTATLLALLLSLTQGVTSPTPQTAIAQGGNVEQVTKLRRLAIATGRDPNRLILADESTLTLHNGRQITGLKAVDRFTGEIVGATFEGDKVVDAKSLRAESAAQWRATHGALTPDLVKKLATLKPDDRIRIAVWLVAEVNPLPKPERLPPSRETVTEFTKDSRSTSVIQASSDTTKQPAQPVPPEQVPAEVRVRLQRAVLSSPPPSSAIAPKSAEAIKQKEDSLPPAVLPSSLSAEQVKVFQQRNTDTLRAQIAPVRKRFLSQMHARGLTVEYASEIVPMAYLELTRRQVEELAFLPEIEAIYDVPNIAGPLLSIARPTQNADLINSVGYTGTGISVAVVEGERIYTANPYLSVAGAFDASQPTADHPTAVGGIIASTHPTYRGLASGASLYSANGSYTNFGVMSAAIDWGSTNARVLNNSYFWQDDGGSSAFFTIDRHLDYIVRYNYDFVTVAAGNFGGAPCPVRPFVISPAKGYNVMSVGNYEDNDTLGWSDDSMNSCSSFGDPRGDSTSYSHAKPEVAAVGSTISSTLRSSVPATAIGPVGSGTSYAAPMVAALAADLIGANTSLAIYPESLRAIIMATALHNIEGDARLSDRDGTGGIVASAAIKTVERGDWSSQSITSTASFPKTFYAYASKGERVRFVINWLSNPNDTYTSDVLPADLDLTAYRADGTTFVQSSASFGNPFEIVDFVAPASETYVFRVTTFSYSGGLTYLGTASWRGTTRLPPNSGYNYGAAPPPLGEHFSVYPTDWSPTN